MDAWRTLRKFGLGYCDLPTMLWNCAVLLRPLLLDFDRKNKRPIPFYFYIVFIIAVISFLHLFVLSGIWYVFFRDGEPGLTTTKVFVLSLVISTEMGPVKFFNLFLNRLETEKLIDGYLACDAEVERDSRFQRNVLDSMRIIKKRAMAYWIVVIGNGIVFSSRPLLHPTKRTVILENYPFYGLEPMLESPNYELTIIICCFAVYFTVYPTANISALIVVMMGYTESQLLGLSCELQEIWKEAEQYCEDVMNKPRTSDIDEAAIKNSFVKQNLKKIINFHLKNVELIRQTERVFQNALAAQILLPIISLIVELLGDLENTFLQIPFAFVQVASDCYAGQKLIDAGDVFEKALYDSKWENFDVPNKKTVLLMLLNSQKTLNLSAGGISVLNLQLLMTLIRSVYSTYTALRSKT